MHPFSYRQAGVIEDAVHLADTAAFIAGGTDQIQILTEGLATPDELVDINALPFGGIVSTSDGGVRIGALVRIAEVAADPRVNAIHGAVTQAAGETASTQVRNMATVGGNLLQRTRCLYFRDLATPCNKREPGTGCAAIGGANRINAIFGGSPHCIAVHPSDLAVAFVACDAVVETTGPDGPRELPIEDLFVLPGSNPNVETTLAHGELITAIRLPPATASRTSSYLKVRDRSSFEWALASCAMAIEFGSDGRISGVRVAAGGVAPVPWRLHAVEAFLENQPLDDDSIAEAARLATWGAEPQEYNGFKVKMLARIVTRMLEEAKPS